MLCVFLNEGVEIFWCVVKFLVVRDAVASNFKQRLAFNFKKKRKI